MLTEADAIVVTKGRALQGPSHWHSAPVIVCEVTTTEVDGGAAFRRDASTDRRTAVFLGGLGSIGLADDPLQSLVDAVIGLQRLATGVEVEFGVVERSPSGARIIVAFEDESLAWCAVVEALRIVNGLYRGLKPDVERAVSRVRASRSRLGFTSSLLLSRARERGIPARHLTGNNIVLGTGRHLRRVTGLVTDDLGLVTAMISGEPAISKGILAAAGIPVSPAGGKVALSAAAASEPGAPNAPIAVDATPPGSDATAASRVLGAVSPSGPDRGCYLALVLNGRTAAIVEASADPGGRQLAYRPLGSAMHPHVGETCGLAGRVLKLPAAVVRFETSDTGRPLEASGGFVVAVEPCTDLSPFASAASEAATWAVEAMLDGIFPAARRAAVPIAAVTGTNGKTTTVRLISHMLRLSGLTVGVKATGGVYMGDRLLFKGDMVSARAAALLLSNPQADAVVLETARGGLLSHGLGFPRADVGVVMNVSTDHLGIGGIDTLDSLANVKSAVVRYVAPDGWAVLNADDPRVAAMAEITPGNIAYFSAAGTANSIVARHIVAGGRAAVLEEDAYVLHLDGHRCPVAGVLEVPLSHGGLAAFQHQNILAALLAAYAMGVPLETMRAGILGFTSSATANPARLNCIDVGDARLVIDYAHNPTAIQNLMNFVTGIPAQRRVGVLRMGGDRRDEDIRQAGRVSAGFDQVILVTHSPDLRGRATGEAAELMRQGLLEAGMAEDRIHMIYQEMEAVEQVLRDIRPGDVLVILASHVREVMTRIMSWQTERLRAAGAGRSDPIPAALPGSG